MNSINQQFVVSMLIIMLGYCLKRFNIIKEQDGDALARVIFNITLPCLIISTFSSIKIEPSLVMLILLSIVYGVMIALLGLYGFRQEASRNRRGMLSMLLPGFNIGIFAYPLVEAIWGQDGLKYFGMFDVGNAFIVFGVAYLIGSHFSGEKVDLDFKTVISKLSRSIPLLGYILACSANLLGLHFPDIVLDTTKIIAKANMPLSLLLLGLYLSFSFESGYLKSMGKVIAVRYLIGLAAGILFFFLLPFEEMFRYTLLIGLILPISASVLPYSVEFDYDRKFVGTLSNITVLVSFFLIWIVVTYV